MIPTELRDSPTHLLVIVDAESLLLGDTGQLDVLRVELLLHDLLQGFQNQRLGLGQRQGAVVFILQLRLCALASRADGLGVISVEGTRGLGVISNIRNEGLVESALIKDMTVESHTAAAHPRHNRQLTMPHRTVCS